MPWQASRQFRAAGSLERGDLLRPWYSKVRPNHRVACTCTARCTYASRTGRQRECPRYDPLRQPETGVEASPLARFRWCSCLADAQERCKGAVGQSTADQSTADQSTADRATADQPAAGQGAYPALVAATPRRLPGRCRQAGIPPGHTSAMCRFALHYASCSKRSQTIAHNAHPWSRKACT